MRVSACAIHSSLPLSSRPDDGGEEHGGLVDEKEEERDGAVVGRGLLPALQQRDDVCQRRHDPAPATWHVARVRGGAIMARQGQQSNQSAQCSSPSDTQHHGPPLVETLFELKSAAQWVRSVADTVAV